MVTLHINQQTDNTYAWGGTVTFHIGSEWPHSNEVASYAGGTGIDSWPRNAHLWEIYLHCASGAQKVLPTKVLG